MYAAVVKFDTLTDTVWTTAQHHHFRTVVGRVGLALFFIGGVHVSGVGGEFRRAGIHTLVNRVQAIAMTQLADFAFGDAGQDGQTRIGEAFALQGAQELFRQAVDAGTGNLFFQTHQLFNLHQEPAVYVSQVEDAVNGQAGAEGVSDVPDAVRTGVFQLTTDFGQCFRVIQAHFRVKTGGAHFQPAQCFLQ
ncbi:hypothetical protein D3C78_1255680 [compost metagenome]